ncbi:hypothetical protein CC78DRAFT_615235 [Lojkania enalia]|uniref:Uncharacterized protein n=1 Tax=Lojkania enalia TaxID=147567 RepID=A0A9P4KGT5_9PLEO|nr:hypothetical protein CC78DRAFT_615235 [Didymosphaeria enalia]
MVSLHHMREWQFDQSVKGRNGIECGRENDSRSHTDRHKAVYAFQSDNEGGSSAVQLDVDCCLNCRFVNAEGLGLARRIFQNFRPKSSAGPARCSALERSAGTLRESWTLSRAVSLLIFASAYIDEPICRAKSEVGIVSGALYDLGGHTSH